MNYYKIAVKTAAKIRQYGSKCELVKGGKKYNSTTNEYDDETAVSGYALQSSFRFENIDGTNIRYSDILLMCVFDEAPKSNDSVKYSGKTYTVVSVTDLNPNGNKKAIYYKVQCR